MASLPDLNPSPASVPPRLYTIGFTRTTAEAFFGKLREAKIATVLDTRIRRDGQLAGFAKLPNLAYFLERLADCAYEALPILAPTAALLESYRDKLLTWERYADAYERLLHEREPERLLTPAALDRACLLCSEQNPAHCHRRLAAEYLRAAFRPQMELQIVHL